MVEEVTKLKEIYERDIVVHGSPQLAQTLIEHDLVDAIHLQVYPIIVGAGKRLFAERARPSAPKPHRGEDCRDGVQFLDLREGMIAGRHPTNGFRTALMHGQRSSELAASRDLGSGGGRRRKRFDA